MISQSETIARLILEAAGDQTLTATPSTRVVTTTGHAA
jgi:hypothetical protein